MSGYNDGDAYEKAIYKICNKKGILPKNFSRAGAGQGVDIKFVHLNKIVNLEVKLDCRADYGQRKLKWSNGEWFWSKDDDITRLYNSLGCLEIINVKNTFLPHKYTMEKKDITEVQKDEDMKRFENKLKITRNALFKYYSLKDTYYMQIGGYGFYCMQEDKFDLKVPKFDGDLILRTRAKTHHSKPIYNYSFFAVLKISRPPTKSKYDIEEINGRFFPPITP